MLTELVIVLNLCCAIHIFFTFKTILTTRALTKTQTLRHASFDKIERLRISRSEKMKINAACGSEVRTKCRG